MTYHAEAIEAERLDADLATAQAHQDANDLQAAINRGGIPFNPDLHAGTVRAAVQWAFDYYVSTVLTVCEALADEGINPDLDQPGLADCIFAEADRLK